MSGQRTSIAVKLTIILVGSITALLLAAAFAQSHFLTEQLEQKSFDALKAHNRMIVAMIDGYNGSLEQAVQRLGRVFAGRYPDEFSLDAESNQLKHGEMPVTIADTAVPDHFTALSGVAATVLTRRGADFVRTSTSITDGNGKRASGVALGADHPAVPKLLKNEPYTGKASMLGRDFMTHYIPIRDGAGEVIGAFFVGLDFTEGLAALKKKVLGEKIGATGYAYALDMGKDAGRLVIHPAREGSLLLGTKDAEGRDFVAEMIEKRDGIINYWWQNPGDPAAREKVVVFNHYPEWNWLIASGSYLDEFNSEGKQAGRALILVAALLAPVVFAIVWVSVRRWVSAPLKDAVALANKVAEGDFSGQAVVASRDEIGALAAAQASMVNRLGRTITHVRNAAARVADDASGLTSAAERVAENSAEQSDAASAMAAAVEQMSTSIDMIAQHAAEAFKISSDSAQVSQSSSETIERAVVAMNHIADTVRQSSEAIERLGRESHEISAIVGTIDDIANQTNLLALNAAIEAARAGEQGRGFAVVADEVRKLAERTTHATHEIGGMIGRIQQGTQGAVDNMNVGVAQVASGVELAAAANEAIRRMQAGARQVSEAVAGISTAIREQSAATTSVAQGLEKIASMTERNNVGARDASHAAGGLQTVAAALRGTVEQFKV